MPAPQPGQFSCKGSPKESLPLGAKCWLQPRPPELGTKMGTAALGVGCPVLAVRYSQGLRGRGSSPLLSEKAQAVHAHIRNGRNFTSWKCRGSVECSQHRALGLLCRSQNERAAPQGDGQAQHMHQNMNPCGKLHTGSYTQDREQNLGFGGIWVAWM